MHNSVVVIEMPYPYLAARTEIDNLKKVRYYI